MPVKYNNSYYIFLLATLAFCKLRNVKNVIGGGRGVILYRFSSVSPLVGQFIYSWGIILQNISGFHGMVGKRLAEDVVDQVLQMHHLWNKSLKNQNSITNYKRRRGMCASKKIHNTSPRVCRTSTIYNMSGRVVSDIQYNVAHPILHGRECCK